MSLRLEILQDFVEVAYLHRRGSSFVPVLYRCRRKSKRTRRLAAEAKKRYLARVDAELRAKRPVLFGPPCGRTWRTHG
jgi:hypothetical protein